jgi:hypothetical protein
MQAGGQACGGACSNERGKCQKSCRQTMFHFHVSRCRNARARAKLSHSRLKEERERLPWLAASKFLARERRTLAIWSENRPSALWWGTRMIGNEPANKADRSGFLFVRPFFCVSLNLVSP